MCCHKLSRLIMMSLKWPSDTTAAQIGHCTNNGFRSKSADPYTFLTFALLSKNFLSSQAVKSFLSYQAALLGMPSQQLWKYEKWGNFYTGSPSGAQLLALALLLPLTFLKVHIYTHCSIPCQLSLSTLNCFDFVIHEETLMTTWLQESFCLALSTEWKH